MQILDFDRKILQYSVGIEEIIAIKAWLMWNRSENCIPTSSTNKFMIRLIHAAGGCVSNEFMKYFDLNNLVS